MNLPLSDSFTDQQRCRPWIPLLTQQLRLRHLRQITAYNVVVEGSGLFYYTLHLTSMSAPFYTSEEIDSPNPKWTDVDLSSVPSQSATACVLRIWQANPKEMDRIILTWGINFSGLVYLGNKLTDVQPSSFKEKAVILHLHGGLFTSIVTLRNDLQNPIPFIDHLNVISTEDETKVYRTLATKLPPNETKKSYSAEKLRRLQSLQISIKSKFFDVELIKNKINQISGLCTLDSTDSPESPSPSTSSNSGGRYTSQLLTMTSLNKMLQEKPTKVQRKEIVRIRKEIEDVKFRVKLLSQERDRKQIHIRQLKQKYMKFCDDNDEFDSKLMEDYHHLSKEIEKLRECKREQIHHREILLEYTAQLHHRRRQLMAQLLDLYPIECTNDQKYKINGVHLPNSELLNDSQYSGNDLAVALGFIAHILMMCSSFLQVPLRYPIIHMGSRSLIVDHITASLGDTKQQYPLYLRGKERLQFNYAVCLLNKNIAQLRWICGLHTQNLKATLPNLLTLLLPISDQLEENSRINLRDVTKLDGVENGHKDQEKRLDELKKCDSVYGSASSIPMSISCFGSNHNISDPILDSLKHECQIERSYSPIFRLTKKPSKQNIKCSTNETGLSQILAIPEAFLNQQISPNSFKSYMSTCNTPGISDIEASTSIQPDGFKRVNEAIQSSSILCCDIIDGKCNTSKNNHEAIEEGKDLTDPCVCSKLDQKNPNSTETSKVDGIVSTNQKRISRSVGSYDEDKVELYSSVNLGSDPFLNLSRVEEKVVERCLPLQNDLNERTFVEKWLNSNVTDVDSKKCTEDLIVRENRNENGNSPLTRRTDALLNTTSFHLVKPKYSD
ncbi:uv radiation resistance-associated protein [Holotrichia oblita]|uniref:Uv radiation resistance-associated protein n=1 Tax=Holotrichia oblita TaxID=644536 RepID=A0ACB9TXC8_HOLOL|nr:uv radiation resistance-associated protein [Holotrichia oblita]